MNFHFKFIDDGHVNMKPLTHTLDKISRPPTRDPYHYPLRFDNQMIDHPKQDLRYHSLTVNRVNNSDQYSIIIIRNREMNRLTQITTDFKFEVTVKFVGLNRHPIPTAHGIEHRAFPSPFVVTRLQFTSNDTRAFDHQWESITFYNPVSASRHKTTIWNLWFCSLWY